MRDKKQHILLAISSNQTAERHNISARNKASNFYEKLNILPLERKLMFRDLKSFLVIETSTFWSTCQTKLRAVNLTCRFDTDSWLVLPKQSLTASERKWSLSSADVRGEELVTSLRTSAWEARRHWTIRHLQRWHAENTPLGSRPKWRMESTSGLVPSKTLSST